MNKNYTMRNLFEKDKFKWTYWGTGLLALGIISQFTFGYFGFFKDLPMPKIIEDNNFARIWGENIRYKNDLEAILVEIPVNVINDSKSYSTSKATVEAYKISKKVSDKTLIYDGEKKAYLGEVMVHKDSSGLTFKIKHPGCTTEERGFDINWNKNELIVKNPVKLKCNKDAAEEALSKLN